jgi:gamma-butyrobetaine dioxygenase
MSRMNAPASPTLPVPAVSSVVAADDRVAVAWADGATDVFHHLWVRDNCACADCRHPIAGERLSDPAAIPLALAPDSVAPTPDGQSLVWEWPDGHTTMLSGAWLRQHAYGRAAAARRAADYVCWTADDFREHVPSVEFAEVMDDDAVLLEWLRAVRRFGFTIVRSVPTDARNSVALASRIGNLRDSNFGREWEVRSVPNPDSLAYTAVTLTAHTDLVSREAQPGLQFLHCLVNDADGGGSLLVDGFAVAEELRRTHPEHFDVLTRVPASFRYQNDATDVRATGPVIRLDHHGRYFEVRYSNALLAPLDCEPDDVVPFYAAYRAYSELLRSPRFELNFRMEAGDCQVFDNRRVLHGRAAFDPNSGERHLQGCYVDTDDFLSRLRVLERTQDFRLR